MTDHSEPAGSGARGPQGNPGNLGNPGDRGSRGATTARAAQAPYVPHGPSHGERELGQAIRRGWRRRCPACGQGGLMRSYLKVTDSCPVCGEELHHQRADDGPAYLTILVVGHAMAPLLGAAYVAWRPEPMLLAGVFAVGCVAASLWLLPRFKGMMVGFQWAKRMHGFAPGLPGGTASGSTASGATPRGAEHSGGPA